MKIRTATQSDAEKINHLRKKAYQSATGTTIQDYTFLNWSQKDEAGIVLYIEDEKERAVSTMRGLQMESKNELEDIFDISINQPLVFPVFVIDRTATAFELRNLGLSGVLRILFIDACLNSDIQNIAITIQEDASRVPLLKEMGYHFEYADVSNRAESVFKNSSRVLLGTLNHKQFPEALEIAKKRLKPDWSVFQIDEEVTDYIAASIS